MNELAVLRLYFAQSARARPTRFWHRLSAPDLGQHLLSAARRAGLQQALLLQVQAGFLPGGRLSRHHIEGVHAHHPLCLELVDREDRLRAFAQAHADELRHVRVLLVPAEPIGALAPAVSP